MKRLSYQYQLKIRMDQPVNNHHFTLRCLPISDARQSITANQYSVLPCDFLKESQDGWANRLLYGCCKEDHTEFEAAISGIAEVGLADCVHSDHPVRDMLFRYSTPLTVADDALKQFAREIHQATMDDLEQSALVMESVHKALRYVPGSTNVQTTAIQAFAAGCGVCQDYAQVMLAVLRSMGIPCRYAVGMVLGEGKSHAWVEILQENRWYGFDPTNCKQVKDEHIKFSHGRDYLDCIINRGLFRGNANQQADISVVVTEI